MHRPLALAATVALLATAAPAGAAINHTIVPGRSIGPVHLLDTRAMADAAVGPGRVQHVQQPTDLPPLVYVRYPHHKLRVGFDDTHKTAKALYMETWSTAFATAKGIRVGSTKGALRTAYPRVKCPTRWFCVLGKQTAGQRVTIFRFRKGAIGLIGLGFIQD